MISSQNLVLFSWTVLTNSGERRAFFEGVLDSDIMLLPAGIYYTNAKELESSMRCDI